ncbi:MAG: DUF4922 domain-containing protein [Syntrophus sp. (in: bacteria)]|nr:DUF4922 domain-containing protein [Syntrophus sp. (in: bacteria)]
MESGRIFAIFEKNDREPSLAALCLDLLQRQKASWPQLQRGYEALKASEIRDVSCPGYALKVQWNPQRIVSSGARTDPASLRLRPCFLCPENLPEAQRAILYRKEFVVLCNPAPIFSQHYTIAHISHRPQSIEPALAAFLSLIRDFSAHFTVLYNGPQSGASAPDHQHFQAAPAGALPVEADIGENRALRLLRRMDGVDVFKTVGMGRAILLLKGEKQDRIVSTLLKVIAALRAAVNTVHEPMMNLLGLYREDQWMILIFPRARHRPEVYYLEGQAQILITPAAVEMGGLFITPLEKDYRVLDAGLVQTIFQDVSVDEEVVSRLVDML